MKKFAKILSLLVVFILVISNCFTASAASNAIISFNNQTFSVGDNVSVTVKINPGVAMYAVDFHVNYDEQILQYNNGASSGGAGALRILESPSGDTSVSYTMNFTAIKSGTCTISVSNCVYEKLGANGAEPVNFGGASDKLTVKDPELSSNANLKSLSINTGSLSPKFSQNRTSYTAKVANNVTKVNVTANVADASAKVVSVTGNSNLKVGENNVVVTVQAANGTQKKYTIVVTRSKENDAVTSNPEDTSSENTTPEEPSPLETVIADTTYTIATEIPENLLFKGFSLSTVKYNEVEVPVATDKNSVYNIYYLKAADSEELVPYTYDEKLKTFERLKYLASGENLYIFEKIPEEYKPYNNLYFSNLNIANFSAECFSSNEKALKDFHYVYCYSNGEYSIYRYDSLENTMQRYPEFLKASETESKAEKRDTILTRFSSLTLNGKIIIIGLLIAVLGAIALIVFLIIFIIKKSSKKGGNIAFEPYDDFDEISEEDE